MATTHPLEAMRPASVTQAELARRMGLSLRSYHEAISRPDTALPRHISSAMTALMQIAVERQDPMLAPANARALALDLAALIRGANAG